MWSMLCFLSTQSCWPSKESMIVAHNFYVRSEQLFRHSRTMTTADKLLITLLVAHEYYHSKPEESDNSGIVVIVIHCDTHTSTCTHTLQATCTCIHTHTYTYTIYSRTLIIWTSVVIGI